MTRVLSALLLAAAVHAGDLEDARRKLASPRAADRLDGIRDLAAIDGSEAIDALADAIKRSGREMDRLGRLLDKNDIDWGRTFDRRMELERRGKVGTDAHRRLELKEGLLNRAWDQLNAEARLHLDVLREAGRALKGFRSPEAVEAIEEGARSHPHSLVRQLYIGGLANAAREGSLGLLGELVSGEKDPRVRAAAVRALVPMAGKGARVAAKACGDPCWAVRRGAYEVLVRGPLGVGVPYLATAAEQETGELQLLLFAYLEHMTGASVGPSHAAWQDWWKRHRGAIEDGTYQRPEPKESTLAPGERRTVATFFRIPIESTNVVFAIDLSRSMTVRLKLDLPRANRIRDEYGLAQTRLGYAKAELIGAILELEEGSLFNIILYSDKAELLFPRPEPATPQTRERAIRWAQRAGPGEMTNIWDALNVAYADYLDSSGGATRFLAIPDTVVFLTDGRATRGRFRRTEALRALLDLWNAPLDVVIHCVGIGNHDEKLLSGLAKETGGFYLDLAQGLRDFKRRDRKPKAAD